MQRTFPTRRREYSGGDGDSDGYRRPYQDRRPPDRRGYPGGRPPDRGGRSPDRGGYPGGGPSDKGGGPLEEDILMEVEDPIEEEDNLVEDPLMEEEGPLIEEDPLDLLEDKDHWTLKDILDP